MRFSIKMASGKVIGYAQEADVLPRSGEYVTIDHSDSYEVLNIEHTLSSNGVTRGAYTVIVKVR